MVRLDIIPKPAPRPRFSKYGTYNTSDYTNYKNLLTLKIQDSIKFYTEKEVKLDLIFHMPIPKSTSVKNKKLLVGTYHTKKPDLDNLIKAVKDSMELVLFKNDSQVCNISAKKIYSDIPGISIQVEEISYE